MGAFKLHVNMHVAMLQVMARLSMARSIGSEAQRSDPFDHRHANRVDWTWTSPAVTDVHRFGQDVWVSYQL